MKRKDELTGLSATVSGQTGMNKVLIIKLSSIGDILMATPAVSRLKDEYNASVSWIVDEGMGSLLEEHPLVDELLLFPRDPFAAPAGTRRTLVRWARLSLQLRKRRFDLAIDLQGRLRTYLLLQTVRADRKIGRGIFPFLSDTVAHRRSVRRHAVLACFESLDLLGLDRPVDPRLVLQSTPDDDVKVNYLLCSLGISAGGYVVILPVTTWPSKNWPADYWAHVADWLVQCRLDVLLVGSGGDRDAVGRIHGAAKRRDRVFPVLGSLTLRQLLPLFQNARLVLGGDTGPLHIAAVSEVPIVALYAASDPLRTGPWPPGRAHILTAPGCHTCRLPRCRQKCMSRIEPSQVIEAASLYLADRIATR